MYLLILLLSLNVFGNSYVLYSDPSTTTVQYPLYSQTILQKSYTINESNPIEYGANWIWTNGTSRIATFQTLFISRFVGSGDLAIKANNSYYAYVNGISVRAGYKNLLEYTSIRLSCGLNNLTIKVENTDINVQSSGLVFRIYQNEYTLANCNNNGFYNYSTCSCQCLGEFTCGSLQQKIGYPTCGCKCVNQQVTRCNLNGQYFDQKTCLCKCFPIYCKAGFEQDPITCNCRCKPNICTNGAWNYNQCRCL